MQLLEETQLSQNQSQIPRPPKIKNDLIVLVQDNYQNLIIKQLVFKEIISVHILFPLTQLSKLCGQIKIHLQISFNTSQSSITSILSYNKSFNSQLTQQIYKRIMVCQLGEPLKTNQSHYTLKSRRVIVSKYFFCGINPYKFNKKLFDLFAMKIEEINKKTNLIDNQCKKIINNTIKNSRYVQQGLIHYLGPKIQIEKHFERTKQIKKTSQKDVCYMLYARQPQYTKQNRISINKQNQMRNQLKKEDYNINKIKLSRHCKNVQLKELNSQQFNGGRSCFYEADITFFIEHTHQENTQISKPNYSIQKTEKVLVKATIKKKKKNEKQQHKKISKNAKLQLKILTQMKNFKYNVFLDYYFIQKNDADIFRKSLNISQDKAKKVEFILMRNDKPYKNLYDWKDNFQNQQFSLRMKLQIMYKLAFALYQMSVNVCGTILHNDLSPRNLLIHRQANQIFFKLIDFTESYSPIVTQKFIQQQRIRLSKCAWYKDPNHDIMFQDLRTWFKALQSNQIKKQSASAQVLKKIQQLQLLSEEQRNAKQQEIKKRLHSLDIYPFGIIVYQIIAEKIGTSLAKISEDESQPFKNHGERLAKLIIHSLQNKTISRAYNQNNSKIIANACLTFALRCIQKQVGRRPSKQETMLFFKSLLEYSQE